MCAVQKLVAQHVLLRAALVLVGNRFPERIPFFDTSRLVVDLETADRNRQFDGRCLRIYRNFDPARDITVRYHMIVPETAKKAAAKDQHVNLTLACDDIIGAWPRIFRCIR